ncbi:MAG: hypothetical protein AAGB14_13060 [Verrucomicrobiota bacterium]
MSTRKKANKAKGRRYTKAEKANIIAYVNKVNAERGRGGQSAASKKFKISPLTISSWIRSGEGGSASAGASSISGPVGKKLDKLKALHAKIASTERELAKMKAQFETLKGSL